MFPSLAQILHITDHEIHTDRLDMKASINQIIDIILMLNN